MCYFIVLYRAPRARDIIAALSAAKISRPCGPRYKDNVRYKIFEVDDEPVGDGIQQSNYIKIDDLSKNSLIDVQVALSLQSNQENEKRETDFVVVQTPFSKFI